MVLSNYLWMMDFTCIGSPNVDSSLKRFENRIAAMGGIEIDDTNPMRMEYEGSQPAELWYANRADLETLYELVPHTHRASVDVIFAGRDIDGTFLDESRQVPQAPAPPTVEDAMYHYARQESSEGSDKDDSRVEVTERRASEGQALVVRSGGQPPDATAAGLKQAAAPVPNPQMPTGEGYNDDSGDMVTEEELHGWGMGVNAPDEWEEPEDDLSAYGGMDSWALGMQGGGGGGDDEGDGSTDGDTWKIDEDGGDGDGGGGGGGFDARAGPAFGYVVYPKVVLSEVRQFYNRVGIKITIDMAEALFAKFYAGKEFPAGGPHTKRPVPTVTSPWITCRCSAEDTNKLFQHTGVVCLNESDIRDGCFKKMRMDQAKGIKVHEVRVVLPTPKFDMAAVNAARALTPAEGDILIATLYDNTKGLKFIINPFVANIKASLPYKKADKAKKSGPTGGKMLDRVLPPNVKHFLDVAISAVETFDCDKPGAVFMVTENDGTRFNKSTMAINAFFTGNYVDNGEFLRKRKMVSTPASPTRAAHPTSVKGKEKEDAMDTERKSAPNRDSPDLMSSNGGDGDATSRAPETKKLPATGGNEDDEVDDDNDDDEVDDENEDNEANLDSPDDIENTPDEDPSEIDDAQRSVKRYRESKF
jgi:hypothetical protein